MAPLCPRRLFFSLIPHFVRRDGRTVNLLNALSAPLTEQLTRARDGKKAIISPSGEGEQKGDHSLTTITELKKKFLLFLQSRTLR